jgi:hypothetical protein
MRQSMGRGGSCFDNVASGDFFSTLEHEVLSRRYFAIEAEVRAVITTWCEELNVATTLPGCCRRSSTKSKNASTRRWPNLSRPQQLLTL